MTRIIRIEVWGRPKPWARARTRHGHYYTKGDVAERMELFAMEGKRFMKGHPPCDHRVFAVTVHALFPLKHVWRSWKRKEEALIEQLEPSPADVDNVGKLVLDALTGVIWKNDRQVVCLQSESWFALHPRTLVEIVPQERRKLVWGDHEGQTIIRAAPPEATSRPSFG